VSSPRQLPEPGRRNRWFRPVTVFVPTFRTWIATLCVVVGLSWFCILSLHDYLAKVAPAPGAKVLIIEAGTSPEVLRYVRSLLDSGRYTRVVPVGTPIDPFSLLASYGTGADLWAAHLLSLGVPRAAIEVVRVPGLPRYRTAHKALAVRRHLDTHPAFAVDLLSPTTHARRSSLIYERALHPIRVGVLSAPDAYDPEQWWNSSGGVRMVVGELLALAYFYLGRDEVQQARESWAELPSSKRQVDGPKLAAPRHD
jgi:hypothetical protein